MSVFHSPDSVETITHTPLLLRRAAGGLSRPDRSHGVQCQEEEGLSAVYIKHIFNSITASLGAQEREQSHASFTERSERPGVQAGTRKQTLVFLLLLASPAAPAASANGAQLVQPSSHLEDLKPFKPHQPRRETSSWGLGVIQSF